ncbi:hypothetical protein [Thermosediminibacter oceani]|uniref:Bacterial toxin 44 domain-containing protein n=1 Tax=Thermosediminibacter oceani (strain ATCC BAA-1034 / DSM 16646 / JW/IW-1228P) TaxID=555079 RepID=D9S0U8_THEOJ|nr:hypothetical protein [Thermosediminibacter oceani]ADL07112.1 hypothetical protein Toce_0331 [Thermosediminibacter oceani DSM 16646]
MQRIISIATLICLILTTLISSVQAAPIDGDLIPIEEYIKAYSENDPKLIKQISSNEYIIDKSITKTDFTRLEVAPGSKIYFLKKHQNNSNPSILSASHVCPELTFTYKTDIVDVGSQTCQVAAWSGIGFFGTPVAAKWCGMGASDILTEPSGSYENHLMVKSYCYGVGLDFSYGQGLSPGFTLISGSSIQYDEFRENLRFHDAKYHYAYAAGVLTSCGTSTRAGLFYDGSYDYIETYINWYTD